MDLDDPNVLAALQGAVDRLKEHGTLKERVSALERRQRDDHRYMNAATGVVHAAQTFWQTELSKMTTGSKPSPELVALGTALKHYHDETDLE